MRGPNSSVSGGEDSSTAPLSISDRDIDFSEYMWMGEEQEEFDRMELYEEDFIEENFDELFREEDEFVEELEKFLCELNVEERGEISQQCAAEERDDKGSTETSVELPFIVQFEVPVQVDLNPYAPVFVPYNLLRSLQISSVPDASSVAENKN